MNVRNIRNTKGLITVSQVYELTDRLNFVLAKSRFTARFEILPRGFKIINVRLNQHKAYCGNHPNACELGDNGQSRLGRYLEGADWVEFNDLLNNFFDRRSLSAYISSAVCIARKNELRRTHYGSYGLPGRNKIWNYDESDMHYTDNRRGKYMISTFPDGTPGIYGALKYSQVG